MRARAVFASPLEYLLGEMAGSPYGVMDRAELDRYEVRPGESHRV